MASKRMRDWKLVPDRERLWMRPRGWLAVVWRVVVVLILALALVPVMPAAPAHAAGPLVSGSPTVDPSSSNRSNASFSHTVAAGSDRLLVVAVMIRAHESVNSVNFGADALTLGAVEDGGDSSQQKVEIWYLVSPDVKTDSIGVSFAGEVNPSAVVAVSFTGVDQDSPLGATAGASAGSGTTASTSIETIFADSLIFGAASTRGGDTDPFTPGTGVAELWDAATGSGSDSDDGLWGGTRPAATAGTYAFGADFSSGDNWAVAAVEIRAPADIPPNPDLDPACGIDVIFIMDESGSIVGTGGEADISAQVRSAADAFLGALKDTGSRVAIVEFNTAARNPIPYTPVTAATIASTFDPYVKVDSNTSPDSGHYDPEDYSCTSPPDCYTNWESALEMVHSVNANAGVAPLVVFFTDGNPTAHVDDSSGLPVIDGTEPWQIQNALVQAVPDANAVKVQGSHIFVVGVPNLVVTEANVQAVSGLGRFDDVEPDFGQADYTITDVSNLADDLRQIVTELCGSTITVNKILDFDGNLATTDDQVALGLDVEKWTFTSNASLPAVSTPTSGPTNNGGNINFEIDFGVGTTASVDIVETIKANYTLLGADCSGATGSNGTYDNTDSVDGISMSPNDVVTCRFYNQPPPMDFGDLPEDSNCKYPTTVACNGARHLIDAAGPWLGDSDDAPDSETDGQPDTDAGMGGTWGDGGHGNSDENGVTPHGNWSDGSGELTVEVSNAPGCLDVWLDWLNNAGAIVPGSASGGTYGGDGDFDDTYALDSNFDEHVHKSVAVAQGKNEIPVALPAGVSAADDAKWYMRTRLVPRDSTGACGGEAYGGGAGTASAIALAVGEGSNAASYTGLAIGGEVEDRTIGYSPTAVRLVGLSADSGPGSMAAIALAALVLLALGLVAGLVLAPRQRGTRG